jgi:hypothetical protein
VPQRTPAKIVKKTALLFTPSGDFGTRFFPRFLLGREVG